jgi:hypothetical protein
LAEDHGYNNCVASGQRNVAVYMLSRVVHDDKNLVVSPAVCMLTLDADSDIGSCSVGSGICRGRFYWTGWLVPKIGVGSGCWRQGSLRLQDVNPLRSDVESLPGA